MILIVVLALVFAVPLFTMVMICTALAARTFCYLVAIAFGVSGLALFPSGRKALKRLV